jgi:hypothetical protein
VTGTVCPDCAEAIEAVGSVGPTARGRAVVAYGGHTSTAKAERLRALLADDFPPSLPRNAVRTPPRGHTSAG